MTKSYYLCFKCYHLWHTFVKVKVLALLLA